jgi:hypothetical protein
MLSSRRITVLVASLESPEKNFMGLKALMKFMGLKALMKEEGKNWNLVCFVGH